MSESPETSPKRLLGRSLRTDGRRAVVALIAVLVLASITFWVLGEEGRVETAGPSGLHYLLLLGNVLLLFALGVSLLRYLIRLLSERRAGILGSRFKFKLVTSFIGLCLIPAVLLYVAAIVIIFEAVSPPTVDEDAFIRDVQLLVSRLLEHTEVEVAKEAADLAEGMGRGMLVSPENQDLIRRELMEQLGPRSLCAARLHFRGRVEVLDVLAPGFDASGGRSPLDPGDVLPQEYETDLARTLSGEAFTRRWTRGDTLFLIAAVPVTMASHAEPAAALFVARENPSESRAAVASITDDARLNKLRRAQAPYRKLELGLLFLSLVLVIILAATWVGLYIARSITEPIQKLVEGTTEVKRGNLAHVVEHEGDDELGLLVSAFNEMAGDLRLSAEEVGIKTSELEGANLELARRRDHMERLLDSMTAGVLSVDATGRVLVANPAARQVLGLEGEPVGRNVGDVLAGEPLEELCREILEALGRSGFRSSKELVVLFERGPSHVHVALASQSGREGEGASLLVLLEDVTELVRAQKLATWQTVARRIAHEIKNPLTPIQLSAQRILKKFRAGASDLPETLEDGVETIVAEVAGLKQMVDEFSRFARMPEVRPVLGDLNALIRSVAALYDGHEGLQVERELQEDLDPLAFDPELLRRALVNLVDNAVEAVQEKGRLVLKTSLSPDGRAVLMEVCDDGPGVPAADRERLFQPYFTTKERGTGLGLAMVNRIAADHGGRVRVEENRPRGSRFVIELPCSSEDAKPVPADVSGESGQGVVG